MQAGGDVKTNKTDWFRLIGAGLYWGIGIQVVSRAFERAMPFEYAFAIAMIVLGVIAYPLFVRPLRKRPLGFAGWMGFVLAYALIGFVIMYLLGPRK